MGMSSHEITAPAISWLEVVPSHWQVLPLKRLVCRIQTGSTPSTLRTDYYEGGTVPWFGPASFGHDLALSDPPRHISTSAVKDGVARLFPIGTTLVVTIGATIGKVGFLSCEASSNQQITGIVFDETKVFPKYAAYQAKLWEPVIRGISPNTTLPIFTQDDLGAVAFLRPSLPEQVAIAAFLDRKTAQIDAVVAKKQRLIERLQEKRQALISHAVTKGLDPLAPLKDSGIEWLGEIPAHWTIERLKFRSPHVTVGIVVTPAKYYVDEGVPCLRSLNVRPFQIRNSDLVYMSEESNRLHAKSIITKNDLVAVRTGQPGTTSVVDERFDGANCIDLIVIRKSPSFSSEFLCYFMNSATAHVQYGSGSGGAIQQHFNIETASNLVVTWPPLEEQRSIVDRLSQECERLNRLEEANRQQIAKLQEYRQTLISAAVTGKIDVTKEAG